MKLCPGVTVLQCNKPCTEMPSFSASSNNQKQAIASSSRVSDSYSSISTARSEDRKTLAMAPVQKLDQMDSLGFHQSLAAVRSVGASRMPQLRAESPGLPLLPDEHTHEKIHMMTLKQLHSIQQDDSFDRTSIAPTSSTSFQMSLN